MYKEQENNVTGVKPDDVNVAKEIPATKIVSQEEKGTKWGYDLYPERKGTFSPSLKNMIKTTEGHEYIDRMKCEKLVYRTINKSPIVKLMMGALKSSGCPVDIRRHISCEVCDPSVTGGYDSELNQIVICQNMCKNEGFVQSVLAHEMVHMFDYCRNKLDFKNLEHLACTEIRAANLTHCSFLSACSQMDASVTNIKQRHQECVKTKAAYSVLAVRKVDLEESRAVVDKVFPKCYADLEPVGRRPRKGSNDMHRAYAEGRMYGYDL